MASELEPAPARGQPGRVGRWRRGLLFVLVFGALALAFTVSLLAAQTTDNPWTETAMITPRNSHSLTLLLDGRALAAGGWDGVSPLAGAEIYDPRANAWQPASPLGEARVFHTASLLPDGRVLVAGGWNTLGHALTTTEVYDPLANAWQPGPAMRSGRAGHTATRLPDGRVLVAGGYSDGGLQAQAELYDPALHIWAPAGTLNVARAHHTTTLLPNGRVLVVGGWDSQGRPLASAELYDPALNAWAPAAALATARLDHTATLLPDGTVLVAGGDNGSYLASAEVYDPTRDAWAAAGDLNVARAYHAAVLLRDGTVLALGGSDGVRAADRVETYDPQARAWTAAGRLDRAYALHLALLLGNGKVLLSGRPDSGDVTGNDGYPTPLPTPTPGPRTPGPLDWLLTPLPTATPRADQGTGANSAAAFPASAAAAAAASVTIPNFSTGADDAGLYGVHEISFTLATVSNPYAATHFVTFTPPSAAPDDAKTVMAFYNGLYTGTQGTRDIWTARVYVNRVGTWTWAPPTGAWDLAGQSITGAQAFAAYEQPDSGLRGMLRVSSSTATLMATPSAPIPGTPKRWYTDDGRTFLPMADTAYRLFFERPTTSISGSIPSDCPPVRTITETKDFIERYTDDDVQRGINTLRVEVLGTWAYPNEQRNVSNCETDMSLFWSAAITGTWDDLFDGSPTIASLKLITATTFLYPNLQSFQRTDEKLKLLLDRHPGLYLQMMLLPEPFGVPDNPWHQFNLGLKKQLWDTMIARWAAFPNVFWSIGNDMEVTAATTNTLKVAQEVGCYFTGDTGSYCSGAPNYDPGHHDPWYQGRPMGMGQIRSQVDYFATATPSAPWHNYITAYSNGDLSAQQMDGTRILTQADLTPAPPRTPDKRDPSHPFGYATAIKPAFNVEDVYEEGIKYPDYSYRRFFWAYLLSGGGVTYGSDETWNGKATYSQANRHGLDNVKSISDILTAASVDLGLFKPNDKLIPTPTGNIEWAEFNRAQVAVQGKQEILAYLPNPAPDTTPQPDVFARRAVTAAITTSPAVTVNMSTFTDPNYTVTWYNPKTGITVTAGGPTPTPIPGSNPAVTLQAPSNLTGDAVVHISSRCTDPNVCEPMDEDISGHELGGTSNAGFQFGVVETGRMYPDSSQRIFGARAWRCGTVLGRPVTPPMCWVAYNFPTAKEIASAEFHFRRNTEEAYLVVVLASHPWFPPDINPPSQPDGGIVVWTYPNGEMVLEAYGDDNSSFIAQSVPNVLSDLNRWYHVSLQARRLSSNQYRAQVFVDGVQIFDNSTFRYAGGDYLFTHINVNTLWAGPMELNPEVNPNTWWDELAVDPSPEEEQRGLRRAFLQQSLGDYSGTAAAYFDYSGGYNNTALLHAGANNGTKSLLRFNMMSIPANAVIDEAILQLYNTGRSNGNSLTLGAHGVLADWIDAEADRTQRKAGVNWNVAGMGSGSDYTATAAATADITGAGNAWIGLNITDLAQAWVSNPATNLGLVLTQEAASGYVYYNFCSELGWSPCTAAQAPQLTIWYH